MINIDNIFKALNNEPTLDQKVAAKKLIDFLSDSNAQIFILRGSAGTGKTSLITALVKSLPKRIRFFLLAPTGRAAKVMSQYASLSASTIHRHIYYTSSKSGKFIFRLKINQNNDTLYFIDEASMLGLQTEDSETSLLEDLIEYVFTGQRNKLILIGDHAQLPPVKQSESPALNEELLKNYFFVNTISAQLNEVVRQKDRSKILLNATRLRDSMNSENLFLPPFYRGSDFRDLKDKAEIFEYLSDAFSAKNLDNSVILVRSNKRANMYNAQIRQRILFKESELDAGDRLMVVKNNYYWLEETSPAGFLANGDILEVLRVYKIEEKYGFRFAKVRARMPDIDDQPPFDAILLLNTLYSESASMGYEEYALLLKNISEEKYADSARKYYKKIVTDNEYANAIQVKFSYAITVHKAQGGQWDTVFVEKPFLPSEQPVELEYLRWLYTALTRGRRSVFLLGFPENYFYDY
ncbi:MAG: ATP-dependent RecD-like DNA helicase [Thermaurantimonas sp.]|uniref:ATP-dependent DNA helicase n=1 Tax=Thermaurantimonas sp. TaxID=2681568 RepID=UPI00391DA5EF